jgi:outer membrane immunogenic protein
MRIKVVSLLAAAMSLGAAQSVFAADMPVKAPAYKAPATVVTYNWTGFYLGADAGYGWGHHDRSVVPPGFQNSYNSTGGLLGLHGGYNWQLQSIILGLETDIAWTGIKGDDGGVGGSLDQTSTKWLGSTRVRLGYAWDRLMLFGTGGWAYGKLTQFNNAGAGQTFDSTRSGGTLGAGVEYAFSPNWSARLDYRHYWLGTFQNLAPTNGIFPYQVNTNLDTVTAGISYKF